MLLLDRSSHRETKVIGAACLAFVTAQHPCVHVDALQGALLVLTKLGSYANPTARPGHCAARARRYPPADLTTRSQTAPPVASDVLGLRKEEEKIRAQR
jgi:hypothetical protein